MEASNVLAGRWFLLLLCCFTTASWAAPVAPQEFVQQTADRTIARLKAESTQLEQDPDRIYAVVQDLLLPNFDFSRMSRWVLGKYWRDATPAQRQRFTEEFRTLLALNPS